MLPITDSVPKGLTTALLMIWFPLQSLHSYGWILETLTGVIDDFGSFKRGSSARMREIFTFLAIVLRTQLRACFIIVCRGVMVSNSISTCWSNLSLQLKEPVTVPDAWKEIVVNWLRMETSITVSKISGSSTSVVTISAWIPIHWHHLEGSENII